MAEGRNRAEWARMSSLMAMIWNVTLRPTSPRKPSDFDPYTKKAKSPPRIVLSGDQMVSMLSQAFCGGKQSS